MAADPYLRAKALGELEIFDISRNHQLFLDNEPAREMAADFLDQMYENRQEFLFSHSRKARYWISDLAHPELWLINAQAMNRIFAFDPVVELAAHIEVSEHEAAKLLGDVNYAYSCGPDIAQAVAETWEIEQLFAEHRAVVCGSAVWQTITHNLIIKEIENINRTIKDIKNLSRSIIKEIEKRFG